MRKSHSRKVADKRHWRREKEFKRKTDEIWNMAPFVTSAWLRKEIDRQFMTTFAGTFIGEGFPKFEDGSALTYDMLISTAKEIDRQTPIEIKMLKKRCGHMFPQPLEFVYDWSHLKIEDKDIADFKY